MLASMLRQASRRCGGEAMRASCRLLSSSSSSFPRPRVLSSGLPTRPLNFLPGFTALSFRSFHSSSSLLLLPSHNKAIRSMLGYNPLSMVGDRFASTKVAKKKKVEKKIKVRAVTRKLAPGELPYPDNGLGVWLDGNTTPEQATKRLKKKLLADGLPQKLRNNQRHTRPAEARRRAKQLTIRRRDKKRVRDKLKLVYEKMREKPIEELFLEALKVSESIA
ncbi:hypothetical protein GUITHDRAFT_162468 [Guillardia theta CCMP2712]|uniref:Uncharacterized protein n=2 Tax=Guillardia theta TaxID=55529 RepID=L1JJN3_GUITC|nr:hypothetical protein GUITHDRAFT_162468 [Guillardia theta CCMP2712]EKX48354.1 hypothetical protein GUITHDRAFT_162468 [Guillardia theta CCMP2712]|mmetsp:Transcript_10177/g.33986  ORF Transcript_10177/g.33986 Transcript_10177/m.33986 type:complete len:220 (+) Transcript_10177:36-695(+)|eukprot:XP_005835334.1 hypothetical protein GUITHDRAFT_162468 [Guillardia theta CCMP2712]